MSECYRGKFILNHEIKSSENFTEDFLSKGKSLYEVIRIIDGVPLFLEDHLTRLHNSAKVSKMDIWVCDDDIKKDIVNLAKANYVECGNVKLIFNFDENGKKSFVVYFIKHSYPDDFMYSNGVPTVLYFKERINPNAKIINYNFRQSCDKLIREKEVYEAILVDRNGYITEGSRSNIFMVKDNVVYTAPIEDVLPGVTRKYIIKSCEDLGYKVVSERIKYNKLKELDGLFISGTSPKVLPINKVDNVIFDPKNSMIQNIKKEYDNIINNYINENR